VIAQRQAHVPGRGSSAAAQGPVSLRAQGGGNAVALLFTTRAPHPHQRGARLKGGEVNGLAAPQRARLIRSDVEPTENPWYSCPGVFEKSFEIELGYDDPSGYEGEGKGRKRITQDDVRHGLDVMRHDYPKHFGDLMADRGDADTADLFIQCAVFGKAVYGCEAKKHSPYPPEAQAEWKRWIAAKKKIVAAAQRVKNDGAGVSAAVLAASPPCQHPSPKAPTCPVADDIAPSDNAPTRWVVTQVLTQAHQVSMAAMVSR
jgi:hypothetical protein